MDVTNALKHIQNMTHVFTDTDTCTESKGTKRKNVKSHRRSRLHNLVEMREHNQTHKTEPEIETEYMEVTHTEQEIEDRRCAQFQFKIEDKIEEEKTEDRRLNQTHTDMEHKKIPSAAANKSKLLVQSKICVSGGLLKSTLAGGVRKGAGGPFKKRERGRAAIKIAKKLNFRHSDQSLTKDNRNLTLFRSLNQYQVSIHLMRI